MDKLSEDKLSEVSMSDNLYGVTLHNLGMALPLDISKDSIILPTATILAGIPILLPQDVCKILYALDIAPRQLSPIAFQTLVGTLVLFKFTDQRVPTLKRFRMLYQIKESHNSIRIYSLSS